MVTMVKAKAKEAKIKGGKGERRLDSLAIADVREAVDAKKGLWRIKNFQGLGERSQGKQSDSGVTELSQGLTLFQ